ncbi:hypothetical protein H8356DRAFT_1344771 [Neocallimastix lanati (nom. inval.)]|nr:hypothetical protein H8356DRAFT_1344771 [Neocallimastix sp. JGI-2020a]
MILEGKVINEIYGLNMPFNETADSLMKLNRRNTIKEEFANKATRNLDGKIKPRNNGLLKSSRHKYKGINRFLSFIINRFELLKYNDFYYIDSNINSVDKNRYLIILNNQGMNPLTIACQFSKDLELIKLLITKISINRQESIDINIEDNNKWNTLMYACRYSESFTIRSNINLHNKKWIEFVNARFSI